MGEAKSRPRLNAITAGEDNVCLLYQARKEMKRCPHKNVHIQELMATYLDWEIEDGVLVGDNASPGDPISRRYECQDCGRVINFGARSTAKRPKWVEVCDEATEPGAHHEDRCRPLLELIAIANGKS